MVQEELHSWRQVPVRHTGVQTQPGREIFRSVQCYHGQNPQERELLAGQVRHYLARDVIARYLGNDVPRLRWCNRTRPCVEGMIWLSRGMSMTILKCALGDACWKLALVRLEG